MLLVLVQLQQQPLALAHLEAQAGASRVLARLALARKKLEVVVQVTRSGGGLAVIASEVVDGFAPDKQYRLVSHIGSVHYGDDEVFVRAGSRSQLSQVVRDSKQRRLLGNIVAQLAENAQSCDELAARAGCSVDDSIDIVRQLVEGGLAVLDHEPALRDVTVVGSGGVATSLERCLVDDSLAEVLRRAELDEVGEETANDQLTVWCSDVRHPAGEQELTLWSMEFDRRILRVCTDGDEALVGPLVIPGQTACLNCYDIQDEATRNFRFDYLSYKRALDHGRAPTSTKRIQMLAAAFAAGEVARVVNGEWGRLVERVLHVNLGTNEISVDRVFRVPRCPLCLRHRPELRHTFL